MTQLSSEPGANREQDTNKLRIGAKPWTPGEWEALKGVDQNDEMRCAVVAVRDDYRYLVATIENGAPGDVCDTEWANAQIIAASPALFEALATIDEMLTDEIGARSLVTGTELHSLLAMPRNIARSALAKARARA